MGLLAQLGVREDDLDGLVDAPVLYQLPDVQTHLYFLLVELGSCITIGVPYRPASSAKLFARS